MHYQLNYVLFLDGVVKSNRPVLLPCGHNMCENCVYHNRRNLMCNVCLKPIELLKQSQQFNLRDYFEMNFYLLGELNAQRYYNRDGSNNCTLMGTTQDSAMSVSNSLGGALSIPITIKCTECELVPASGKCRQCKVYMCKCCFDKVHKDSKVLKIHTMQRLDKNTNPTDMERLVKPHFCKRHQKVHDRFCKKCNYTCCIECAIKDHQYHGYQTIFEVVSLCEY